MTNPRTLQTEQEHHRKAFEIYYAQGEKRSLARLAAELGISVATAKAWGRSFGWRKRIGEREATVARQVADNAISSAQETQSRNRRLIELATNRLAKAMLNGQIKYQLADLDRLIRLQSFLDAEAKSGDRTIDELLDQFVSCWLALPDAEKRRVLARMRGRAGELRGVEQRAVALRALPNPALESTPIAVEPSGPD